MSLAMLQLISSQRALLDALEAEIREKKIPEQFVEAKTPQSPTDMTPEEEAYYSDYVERERQELLRQARAAHQVRSEHEEEVAELQYVPESEEEEAEAEPIILPHVIDKMVQKPERTIGGLNQQELIDSLNI